MRAARKECVVEDAVMTDLKEVNKCENEYCRDFGKVFRFKSLKDKHERYVLT